MPKRKFNVNRKRRVSKRSRTVARRRPARRGVSSSVHYYKRWGTPSTVTLTGTTESNNAETFSLNAVQSYTELTNLYDMYHISAVVVKFTLLTNPDGIYPPGQNPTTTTNNPTWYPKIWYYRDYDDAATLTLAQMREVGKAKCKILKPNSFVTVKIKPACAQQIYYNGVTPAFNAVWPKKLDCTYPGVPHYGLKWIIDTQGVTPWSSGQFIVRVEYNYYLRMMNTR